MGSVHLHLVASDDTKKQLGADALRVIIASPRGDLAAKE
jgi:hypothetical protein